MTTLITIAARVQADQSRGVLADCEMRVGSRRILSRVCCRGDWSSSPMKPSKAKIESNFFWKSSWTEVNLLTMNLDLF